MNSRGKLGYYYTAHNQIVCGSDAPNFRGQGGPENPNPAATPPDLRVGATRTGALLELSLHPASRRAMHSSSGQPRQLTKPSGVVRC